MLTFDRKRGNLLTDDGTVSATGIWSGHGVAANDPLYERSKGIGPLPAGFYTIGRSRNSVILGRLVMDLNPDLSNEMYGRNFFRIHGDTVNDTMHVASDGCIIAPYDVRERIDHLPDRRLKVI